jgi:hypothetical protein
MSFIKRWMIFRKTEAHHRHFFPACQLNNGQGYARNILSLNLDVGMVVWVRAFQLSGI